MKNILLILLALFAVSAWAADVPTAQATHDVQAGVNNVSSNSLQSLLSPQKAGEDTLTSEPEPVLTRPAVGCNVGCLTMHCPPPNGPVMCCNTSTYQACP